MLNIAVISPSPSNLELIARLLHDAGQQPQMLHLVEGGMSKLRGVVNQAQPDLVILDSMCRDAGELGELEAVTMLRPQLAAIMLCTNHTPEFLLRAMRAGVREVLSSPVDAESLLAAIGRADQKLGSALHGRRSGEILAFMPCKGGSGSTFIAANAANQLAAEGRKVILIDLNLQFGDAVLFVHDHSPKTTLADVARNIHRLDASFLAASLVQVNPQFGVLAAPEDPGQAMEVRPEHIDALLNLAVAQYDFVMIDIGRSLDAVTIKALDRARRVFPVMQMTLPFLRDAHRLLTVFRSLGYAKEKIHMVVNRYERGSEITLDDVERVLGCDRPFLIPNSYAAVAASVNHGQPMLELARNNPVTKALQEFVQGLLPADTQGNWLSRLKRREQKA